MWRKNFKNSFFLEIWWFVFSKNGNIATECSLVILLFFSLRRNFKPKKKKTRLWSTHLTKPCLHYKGNYARLVTPSPPTTRQKQFGAPVCCTGCTCVACLRFAPTRVAAFSFSSKCLRRFHEPMNSGAHKPMHSRFQKPWIMTLWASNYFAFTHQVSVRAQTLGIP